MDKDLEVIFVTGKRGSGKTTRVKNLLDNPDRKRVFVYDIKGEYPYKKIHGLREFGQFMRQNFRKSFKVSYVPTAKEKSQHIAEFSKICYKLGDAQRGEYEAGLAQNLTIIAEEMSLSAPNQRYPEGQGGFEYVVNICREWGIEVIGVSQRPAQVNPDFRSNASKNYFLQLADRLDVDAVKQKMGQHVEKLKELKPHEYVLFDNGKITLGKNVLRGRK